MHEAAPCGHAPQYSAVSPRTIIIISHSFKFGNMDRLPFRRSFYDRLFVIYIFFSQTVLTRIILKC